VKCVAAAIGRFGLQAPNLPGTASMAPAAIQHFKESPMKSMPSVRYRTATALFGAALLVGGCASSSYQPNPTRDTAIGTAAGAAVGAAVHSSNRTHGALAGAAIAGIGSYLWSRQMAKQTREMEAATQGTGIQVTQTADNQLKLEVPSDVSFAVGSAQIQPNFDPVLNRFAQTLSENPKTTVRIVGHTDSTGSDAINDPLSVARARTVRDYLEDRGVPAARLDIAGRGSREPIADNTSDAGRAKNRRVEIFLREPSA
jgi:outer membrane protein OmpA-like peptidoglycan-associated protein